MALVVMRHSAAAARLERQTRLSAVERLDLEAADEPLSGARLERLECLNGILHGMAKAITNTLNGKSVSILKGLIAGAAEPDPAAETPLPPERMRWCHGRPDPTSSARSTSLTVPSMPMAAS
jgi:hypothetical protein